MDGIHAVISLDPKQFWGIPLALLGAALLAFGAQYQSRGVNKVERIVGDRESTGLSFSHLMRLLKRPSWVFGTLFLGLATVFQLGSLALSPIIIVQPIGVVGLVITSILNSRLSGVSLDRRVRGAVACAVIGIVIFVSVAAFTAVDRQVTDRKLLTILIIFGVALAVTLLLVLALRRHRVALVYIIGAGVLYGFVATFAKSVIGRIMQWDVNLLTWVCVAALIVGALVGMVFVQNAYSSGPPDLVVAGLTVIDPIIAVLIGVIVLGEAVNAPLWAYGAYAGSGALAIIGVVSLAKYHPQTGRSALDTASVPVVEKPN